MCIRDRFWTNAAMEASLVSSMPDWISTPIASRSGEVFLHTAITWSWRACNWRQNSSPMPLFAPVTRKVAKKSSESDNSLIRNHEGAITGKGLPRWLTSVIPTDALWVWRPALTEQSETERGASFTSQIALRSFTFTISHQNKIRHHSWRDECWLKVPHFSGLLPQFPRVPRAIHHNQLSSKTSWRRLVEIS